LCVVFNYSSPNRIFFNAYPLAASTLKASFGYQPIREHHIQEYNAQQNYEVPSNA
jgi:hypothetical protein